MKFKKVVFDEFLVTTGTLRVNKLSVFRKKMPVRTLFGKTEHIYFDHSLGSMAIKLCTFLAKP